MKLRRLAGALLIAMVTWCSLCVTAFADNELVPYDPSSNVSSTTTIESQSTSSTSKGSSTPNYTEGLFQEPQIVKDETVTGITNTVTDVASIVITFAISVAPVLLAIQMVIDFLCIVFKPIALVFSRMPFQINSDEVIMITGIQFTGTGENNSSSIEKKDLKGENPIVFYLKNRIVTIILVFTVLVLLGTGLLFKGVFFLANTIAGWIAGLF